MGVGRGVPGVCTGCGRGGAERRWACVAEAQRGCLVCFCLCCEGAAAAGGRQRLRWRKWWWRRRRAKGAPESHRVRGLLNSATELCELLCELFHLMVPI